jgi:ABC-2 type transport system permease protein
MKRFWVLFVKELRELLTPQTLVPIALVVLVFLGLGKLIAQQSKAQTQPQPIVVVDQDHSAASAGVVALLKQNNFSVTQADALPDFGRPSDHKAAILIPAGFGQDLKTGQPASLQTYTIQSGFSVARLADTGLVSGAVAQLNAALAAERLAALAPHSDTANLLAPVHNDAHMVVNGKVAAVDPGDVAGYIGTQISFVPVVLFIVILFAGQMVATAMANEKENKTLETLLSLPISRTTIVAAKMLAAGVVASATAAAYVYAVHGLQTSFTGSQSLSDSAKAAISQLGLNLSLGGYALLGLALFLGILVALAMALVLGAFADNIKSVQSLIMPLMVLLLVPYLATMISNFQTLPTAFRYVLYAIPFTYTFQAMPNLYAHNYGQVLLGSAYELVVFIVFMLLAARLFSSDQLLTLRLGWLTRRKG